MTRGLRRIKIKKGIAATVAASGLLVLSLQGAMAHNLAGDSPSAADVASLGEDANANESDTFVDPDNDEPGNQDVDADEGDQAPDQTVDENDQGQDENAGENDQGQDENANNDSGGGSDEGDSGGSDEGDSGGD